jgi:asparagine synthase (glutamine-hydrolysing)
MCGFIGCISKEPISYSEYHKANEHIVCRGPDKNIFYNNENQKFNNNLNKYFHFEFNRLSILDLSKGADQPMHSKISNNLLMFNGEIYNHLELRKDLESVGVTFKTNHSDTEVILNGISNYGLNFVEKLNGQFAIFFLNNKLNKAYLIRDRLGQKPLYYTLSSDKLLFSSNFLSISDILQRSNVNTNALHNYLNIGVIPGKETILNNVSEVLPAQILEFDLEDLTLTKTSSYWDLKKISGNETFREDEFHSLFSDSVKIRQNADVPVAYFLSGGIDSTSILQSASETSSEIINTFSVIHENDKYDESYWSNIASEKFKTNHNIQKINEDIGIEIINEALNSIDQPYFDPSVVPSFMLSKMISSQYKVGISGDGGDELLGGYERVIQSHSINKRTSLAKSIYKMYPSFLGTGNKILKYSKNIPEAYWSFHEDLKLMKLLKINPDLSYRTEFMTPSTDITLKDLMIADYKFFLSQMMLFKVDRTSMANSLEVRSPFLDHRLIEYVLNTNMNFINHDEPKKIMKDYLSKNFDNSFLNRKKQGFVFNVENWVYNNMSYLEKELKSSIVTSEYNKNILSTLSLNKTRINGIRIWKLFVLSQFMKRL